MMKTLISILLAFLQIALAYSQEVGKPMPSWTAGHIDIHHINTGHGVCAFLILPDGTTLLVDAGEMDPTNERTRGPRNAAMHPNESREAYDWIVRYIRRVHPNSKDQRIDYALISHFHDDHFGTVHSRAKKSTNGNYVLTGITGVGDQLGFRKLLDRGYPDYKYPFDMRSDSIKTLASKSKAYGKAYETMLNYWNFIDAQSKKGMKTELFAAGAREQVTLIHDRSKYGNFSIVNVKSNGSIWTGQGKETAEHFPPGYVSGENPLSLAFRLDYGNFRYYSGGDNPGVADLGESKYNDVETAICKAVGAVDVAVMDHHGNRDSQNETFVSTLEPRVWVEQTWSSDHPGHEVLRRVTSNYLYPGARDLFATNMLEANKNVIGSLIDQAYKSTDGHIVVRVAPGGESYRVIILNDENEVNEVKSIHGPYTSTAK
jgi:beta-lactamase superfamily II metal-dependent hydrolase